jgi:predicted permease
MNDLKFAFRQLLKNPGFTAVAVLTLALGIGANTTIFTFINAALFKPILARDPDKLIGLFCHEQKNPLNFRAFSYPNFADLRADKEIFEDVLAFAPWNVGIQQGDLTRSLGAHLVSANYFSVLGVAPHLGRGFLPEEETVPTLVAVLSHSYWKRHGADPSIIGQTVTLNNRKFTVVGVMPPKFTGTMAMVPPSLFLPLGTMDLLETRRGAELTDRSNHRFTLVARLKPGLAKGNLSEPLGVLSARLAQVDPRENQGQVLKAAPLARLSHSNKPDKAIREIVPLAGLSLGLAFVVLLIACLNLANMLLARGVARGKEIAVRLALGAGRGRIVRQLLIEGFLLALLGGMAGVFAAIWTTDAFVAFASSNRAGEPFQFDAIPDWRVLLASLGFCTVATLLFALVPAWRLARQDVNARLKENSAEDAAPKRAGLFALRHLLVIGQVGLSLALVLVSALFARSAMRALDANPGFAWGSNFMIELQGWMAGYEQPLLAERYRGAVERVGALPGVASVSFGLSMPFGSSHHNGSVQRAGSPPVVGAPYASPAEGQAFTSGFNVIGADYFRTLGVPLLRGREFSHSEVDNALSARVAIINPELAEALWPGEDPLGKRLQFTKGRATDPDTSMEVVGLAPRLKQRFFDRQIRPFFWVPYGQDRRPSITIHVRVAPGVDPAPLMQEARAVLRSFDANLPVTALKTLRAHHQDGENVGLLRMGAILFGSFGFAALLLAAVGVYGVRAFAVARRTREIGIRMALGASAGEVLRLVLREGARLTLLGLGLGLLLAAAIAPLAARFLYEVSPLDPWAFTIASAVLAAAALLACWLPARRAALVDPMKALRHE